MPISTEDVVVCDPRSIAAEVQGEIVLLNLDKGSYYGLDHIGSAIWRSLDQATSVEKLCVRLAADFETSEETVRMDLLPFLEQLYKEGLVELHPAK